MANCESSCVNSIPSHRKLQGKRLVCLQQTTDCKYYLILEDRTLKDIKMPCVQWFQRKLDTCMSPYGHGHSISKFKCKATKQDRKHDLPP